MKTLRFLTISAGLFVAMACTAEASDVAIASGDAAAAKPSCAASYKEEERAVDAEKRWSYFKDVVRAVSVDADGTAWVSFQKSSRRYKVAATEKALVAAAKAALEKKTAVHVAIEEGTQELSPDAAPGTPAQLKWLDAKEQHPSCR